ncbi:hypothetical protein Syun_027947 [Stephania yunnanensis]|uniref:Uncharacterized protein n=1 Tax=Stephania yunnanensis TaxID=152371 RepID=A0AAP0EGG5_9MAGN
MIHKESYKDRAKDYTFIYDEIVYTLIKEEKMNRKKNTTRKEIVLSHFIHQYPKQADVMPQIPQASVSANRASIRGYRTPHTPLYPHLSSSPPPLSTTVLTQISPLQSSMAPSHLLLSLPNSPYNPSSSPKS